MLPIDACKNYDWLDILFLSLGVPLSAAANWSHIALFITAKLAWLRQYPKPDNDILHHPTFTGVLCPLDPSQVRTHFIPVINEDA